MDSTFKEALAKSLVETAREQFEFDESKHPRDEKGRWSDGGDAGAAAGKWTVDENHAVHAADHHERAQQELKRHPEDSRYAGLHKIAAQAHEQAAKSASRALKSPTKENMNIARIESHWAHNTGMAAHLVSTGQATPSAMLTRLGGFSAGFAQGLLEAARQTFEFDEAKHPRDKGGKWTSGEGGDAHAPTAAESAAEWRKMQEDRADLGRRAENTVKYLAEHPEVGKDWPSGSAGGMLRDLAGKVFLDTSSNDHPKNVTWGKPYAAGTPFARSGEHGKLWAFRNGQRVRLYDAKGKQVGPEQANVAPAAAYVMSKPGWQMLSAKAAFLAAVVEAAHQKP